MKYAAAMRYGGEIVDACDCDYEDYRYLGLLCAECKEPVFLRAAGVRKVNDKEIPVGAHFCHFKTKDPELAKACENRVGGYTAEEIERRSVVARGQRLKVLQRYFWDMFLHSCDYGFPFNSIYLEQRYFLDKTIVSKIMDFYKVDRKSNLQAIKNRFNHVCQALLDDKVVITGRYKSESICTEDMENPPKGSASVSTAMQYMFFKKVSRNLDRRLHLAVAKEVFDFVLASNNQQILRRMLVVASFLCLDVISDGCSLGLKTSPEDVCLKISDGRYLVSTRFLKNKNDFSAFYGALFTHVFVWIAVVPWSEAFAKFEK